MISILRVFSLIFNLVPKRICLGGGRLLGWLAFDLVRFRRRTVEENLRLAYGGALQAAQIRDIARANYQHYVQLLIEFVRSITWNRERMHREIRIEGLEYVHDLLRTGKGGIFLTGHLGNWEFLVASSAVAGVPLDIVVKHARNSILEKLLKWYRERWGVGVLLESGTANDIMKSIGAGRLVGFVFDQFMGPPIGLPVQFFGRLAGTTASIALLTEKRPITILPVYSYRDTEGTLHTVIRPAIEYNSDSPDRATRLYEKTQRFNDELEQIVKRHPEQWLWIHRRWKPYVGTCRWSLTSALSSVAFLFFVGCAAQKPTTGIVLPPAPEIEVPSFQSMVIETKIETPLKTKPKKTVHQNAYERAIIPRERVPFEVGERMDIDLNWANLPAGRLTLEVAPSQRRFRHRPTLVFLGTINSSKLVDTIYRVRNSAESYVDQDALIPYEFSLHMEEAAQLKEVRMSFDHMKGKAYFNSKRKSEKWGNEEINRTDELHPLARDLFSAVYYSRILDYKLKRKESFSVYDNGQNWEVELLPVANELVTVKAGAFQCWKIAVSVKLNNILKPTGDVFMWVSDDSKKYLVKFTAQIKVGSVIGVLSEVKER